MASTTLRPSPPSSISSSSDHSGSSRSRLSFLSTSSSSTFSDISVSSLPSPPPHPGSGSKTHAFFASPFPTRPPSPSPPPPPPSSKTHAFFSIPTIDISTPTIASPQIVPDHDTSSQPTPRPRDLLPSLPSPPPPHPNEPSAGDIISSATSHSEPITSPLSPASPLAQTTTLKLVRPLGTGAFSSVWLAEDLSPVPLVLRSRRSLRDLRRQASLKSGALASSANVSRTGSLRSLRARVPGTRPIRSLFDNSVHNDSTSSIHSILDAAFTPATDPPRYPQDESGHLAASLSRASSTSSTSTSASTKSSNPRQLTISIHDPKSPATDGSLSRSPSTSKGRLVAVKMTVRGGAGGVEGDEEKEKEKERTRVAFVREVEVLRHISHPNITPLLSSLSTPTHHLLVLPFLTGGDLLSLVNTDAAWARLREGVVKRMWAELCRAVGWMHGVGLVHRDVKLENILLTTPIFTSLGPDDPAPTLEDLPVAPAPLIKLTDFGLSRFVDIRSAEERRRDRRARRAAAKRHFDGSGMDAYTFSSGGTEGREEDEEEEDESEEDEEDEGPLLSTRCGSEAYAAPELVMGSSAPPRQPQQQQQQQPPQLSSRSGSGLSRSRAIHLKSNPSNSPGSHSDATTTPTPPIEPLDNKSKPRSKPSPSHPQSPRPQPRGIYDARETDAWACGVVLFALVARRLPFGEGVGVGGMGGGGIGREGGQAQAQGRMARRAWLMRIARGEYEWPEAGVEEVSAGVEVGGEGEEAEGELMGTRLALSAGARRIVGRLLVRDPRKRARVADLWGDVWMGGDGEDLGSAKSEGEEGEEEEEGMDVDVDVVDSDEDERAVEEEEDVIEIEVMGEEELEKALAEAEEELDEEGWLVDQEGIGDIARREVV